jgi:hypothetical protein
MLKITALNPIYFYCHCDNLHLSFVRKINPLMPELNCSAQHCLARSFYWGFCFLNRAFC